MAEFRISSFKIATIVKHFNWIYRIFWTEKVFPWTKKKTRKRSSLFSCRVKFPWNLSTSEQSCDRARDYSNHQRRLEIGSSVRRGNSWTPKVFLFRRANWISVRTKSRIWTNFETLTSIVSISWVSARTKFVSSWRVLIFLENRTVRSDQKHRRFGKLKAVEELTRSVHQRKSVLLGKQQTIQFAWRFNQVRFSARHFSRRSVKNKILASTRDQRFSSGLWAKVESESDIAGRDLSKRPIREDQKRDERVNLDESPIERKTTKIFLNKIRSQRKFVWNGILVRFEKFCLNFVDLWVEIKSRNIARWKRSICFVRLKDGRDLPVQIGFGVDKQTVDLPKSNPHSVPAELQDFLGKFIDEYYRLFDTNGRQDLQACYHDSCLLSICVSPTEGSIVPTRSYRFGALIYDSRNYKKLADENKLFSLLRSGKSNVLDFLRVKFPATKHEGSSFHVDVISTSVRKTNNLTWFSSENFSCSEQSGDFHRSWTLSRRFDRNVSQSKQ